MPAIAQQTCDNTIQQTSNGWSVSTGNLDATFADTIGTTNAIEIIKEGYTFAWKPDTVEVMDTNGNLTDVSAVNPNATAQVWQNKLTYVGTTPLTSDEFTVQGNQLKHDVRMVAPPRLPSGYTGTPQYLAIGGDIGTVPEDWNDIALWADNRAWLTDFTTSDDLRFCRKSDGREVYRIPHITVVDANGQETTGQWKMVFQPNNVVTMYMLVDWNWLQNAAYPLVIDPTVIVSSGFDPSTGSGRRLVELSNTWILALLQDTSVNPYALRVYVSKDGSNTWSQLCYMQQTVSGSGDNLNDAAIVSNGTNVCVVASWHNNSVLSWTFDATTVTNTNLYTSYVYVDQNATAIGPHLDACVDNTGYIHVTWCTKTTSVPNSYNIRYAKSTNFGTSWSTAVYCSTNPQNVTGSDDQYPCIVTNSSNLPVIIYSHNDASGSYDMGAWYNDGTQWHNTAVYTINSNQQKNPKAVIDTNSGYIHVVWQGVFSGVFQIVYSYSTDGGQTWQPVLELTTSSYTQAAPTIGIDNVKGDLYVLWTGIDSTISTSYYQVREIVRTASTNKWSNITTLTNQTTANANSVQILIYDPNLYYMWQDAQASSVDIAAISFDSPPNAPILNTINNFDATEQQTFTWQFSDPNVGDTQSAFQLQVYDVAGATTVFDTSKVASPSQQYTLAANQLVNGKQYQWRVATWDSYGTEGPFSNYSTFNTSGTPSATITTPSADETISTTSLTVEWSFSDPEGDSQQSFDVQLLDANSNVLYDSGTVSTAVSSYTIPYTLVNGTTYKVSLVVTNSQSVSSAAVVQTFSASVDVPTAPTITATAQTGYIQVVITNPSSTVGVVYNDLYRANTGTGEWTRIATQLPVNGTYADYAVASGQGYDYMVTSIGNNGTTVNSNVVSNVSITLTGLWVHDVNDPAGTVLNLLYFNNSSGSTDGSLPNTRSWSATATQMQFAGRTFPVMEFGEAETFTLSQSKVTIPTSDNQWPALESMIRVNKSTYCFRDGRGTCLFGSVPSYAETDLIFGNMVDLEITQVDYTIAV